MTDAPSDPVAEIRIRNALEVRPMDCTELQRATGYGWNRLYPAIVEAQAAGVIAARGSGAGWRLFVRPDAHPSRASS